jgi:hypothetical protein
MCVAVMMAAMIAMTRLRPSSIGRVYKIRHLFATRYTIEMWRLLLFLSIAMACASQVPAGGTIITVIPASGGMVVASDTRTSLTEKLYCDGHAKLIVPRSRKRTVVFYTNDGLQTKEQPTSDICAYLKSTSPLLDINQFLAQQVDTKKREERLSLGEVQQIAERCRLEVVRFARENGPNALKQYSGSVMFRAAIVNYDVKDDKGLLGSFAIRVNSVGNPSIADSTYLEFAHTDKAIPENFGETDYVRKNAYDINKLSASCVAQLNPPITVSRLTLADAKCAALSLIKAVVQFAKTAPPPGNTIGGRVDVATITKTGVRIEPHSAN